MISDELKHIIGTTDEHTFVDTLLSWYTAKLRQCKNPQELKTLLYQIDFNWDKVPELKQGWFKKFLELIYENEALEAIKSLMGWKL